MRLRRSDCAGRGVHRIRSGRGFRYVDVDGTPVRDEILLDRINSLVIPPAWRDVWVCPWANGHIQAVGTDAAGRRQYLYHQQWRVTRDSQKHDRVLNFATALPAARERVASDLASRGPNRDRVLAGGFRFLDLGFLRVGSESYADENGTYGLATLRRAHVEVSGDTVHLDYPAKGSLDRTQRLIDPELARLCRLLLRRDHDHPELLAFRDREGWHDLRSEHVNAYIRAVTGGDFTAKDFRTWNATVLMAQGLAVAREVSPSVAARKKAVTRAVKEVAGYLGNTPTVARASYIDRRIVDLYLDGVTVDPELVEAGMETAGLAVHGAVEEAVRAMIQEPRRRGRA